jgi:hypothetical protein
MGTKRCGETAQIDVVVDVHAEVSRTRGLTWLYSKSRQVHWCDWKGLDLEIKFSPDSFVQSFITIVDALSSDISDKDRDKRDNVISISEEERGDFILLRALRRVITLCPVLLYYVV